MIIIKVFQGVINIMVGTSVKFGVMVGGFIFSSDDDSRKESKIHEY